MTFDPFKYRRSSKFLLLFRGFLLCLALVPGAKPSPRAFTLCMFLLYAIPICTKCDLFTYYRAIFFTLVSLVLTVCSKICSLSFLY